MKNVNQLWIPDNIKSGVLTLKLYYVNRVNLVNSSSGLALDFYVELNITCPCGEKIHIESMNGCHNFTFC